jgi:hypothetical protein
VLDQRGFPHCAKNVTSSDKLPLLNLRFKMPFLFPVYGWRRYATGDIVASQLRQTVKRSLDTIKDAADQAGTQFN